MPSRVRRKTRTLHSLASSTVLSARTNMMTVLVLLSHPCVSTVPIPRCSLVRELLPHFCMPVGLSSSVCWQQLILAAHRICSHSTLVRAQPTSNGSAVTWLSSNTQAGTLDSRSQRCSSHLVFWWGHHRLDVYL